MEAPFVALCLGSASRQENEGLHHPDRSRGRRSRHLCAHQGAGIHLLRHSTDLRMADELVAHPAGRLSVEIMCWMALSAAVAAAVVEFAAGRAEVLVAAEVLVVG